MITNNELKLKLLTEMEKKKILQLELLDYKLL